MTGEALRRAFRGATRQLCFRHADLSVMPMWGGESLPVGVGVVVRWLTSTFVSSFTVQLRLAHHAVAERSSNRCIESFTMRVTRSERRCHGI
jgi:hypothetical protein